MKEKMTIKTKLASKYKGLVLEFSCQKTPMRNNIQTILLMTLLQNWNDVWN